jgi:hypothetical protein
MPRKATAKEIDQALKALGLAACPVMQATVEDGGAMILYLVPNPEPVRYKPQAAKARTAPSKIPRSGGGRPKTTKKSGD